MKQTRTRHHGMALMIVLAAVAMASLIGLAMLSNASLQAQVAGNHARGAQSDYLSESAMQVASYYLQRDLSGAPSSWTNTSGYTLKARGVTVSGVTGSFDISATASTAPDTYNVIVAGHSGSGTTMDKNVTSTVKVVRATPAYSGGFGGAISIPAKYIFNGPVVAGGAISGAGTVNITGGTRTSFQSTDFAIPSSGQVNYYGGVGGGTYTMGDGTVGTPDVFNTDNVTILGPFGLNASATNPGHVFVFKNNVTFTIGGVYNASIIAPGLVQINSLVLPVTFNRPSGFPAIVAGNGFKINATLTNITVNGVVYAKGVSWGALTTGTTVAINGALLMPSGTTLPNTNGGTMTVNYSPTYTDVLKMTTTVQPPIAVKYASWAQ